MYITFCNTFNGIAPASVTALALNRGLKFRSVLLSMSLLALDEGTCFRMCDEVCDQCLSMSYFFGQMDSDRILSWLNEPCDQPVFAFTRIQATVIRAATTTGG